MNSILIDQPKEGSYAARNLGIAHAKGKFLVFTDSDCKPKTDWLAQGLFFIEKGFDMAGGAVTFFKENPGNSDLVFSYEKNFSFNQKRNVEEETCSITANLFVKREVFDQVGGFREDIYSGADTEWTKRATINGATIIFAEAATVEHPSRKTLMELYSKKKRTSGGYFNLVFKKKSFLQKLATILLLLRPPISIFSKVNESFLLKFKLFLVKWSLEFIGVWELVGLSFGAISPKRS